MKETFTWILILLAECCGKSESYASKIYQKIPTEQQCQDQGHAWIIGAEKRGFLCLKQKK